MGARRLLSIAVAAVCAALLSPALAQADLQISSGQTTPNVTQSGCDFTVNGDPATLNATSLSNCMTSGTTTVTDTQSSASIDVDASFGGSGSLDLNSGAGITESQNATLTADDLQTTSAGNTTLTGSNAVATFSATNGASGDVAFTNGPNKALSVAGVNTTGGGSDGNVTIASGVDLTVAGSINATGTVVMTAVPGANPATLQNTATISAPDVILIADAMSLSAGQVNASDSATLTPATAGDPIDLAGTDSGALDLGSADLDSVVTPKLVIDTGGSGPITLSGAVAPAHAPAITLSCGGSISGGSIDDPSIELDTTSPSTAAIAPASVRFGNGPAVGYAGASTLAVRAPDTLDVTPSPSTTYSVNGLGSGVLNYVTGGHTVSGTPAAPSGTVTASQVQPVTYSGMTAVNLVPSAAASTISTSSPSLTADGTSTATITVQAKDASGADDPSGGNDVTMHTTMGTLSAVADHGDGTYTATLMSGTQTGTADVSATIDGAPITSGDAIVTFTAIPPAGATPPTTTTTVPPTTSTTAPPTPAPPATSTGPVAVHVADVSTSSHTIVWCLRGDCGYPDAQLRFTLTRATSVRLVLRARSATGWRAIATARLTGRAGVNRDRIAGRWHGQLVPARPVQILVQLRFDGRWRTEKTLTLVVRHRD